MVGIIPPNLRSQETENGVPRAVAGRAGPRRRRRAGGVVVCFLALINRGSFNSGLNLSVARLFVSRMRDPSPSAARLLA
jgi:hypothetical protein